MQNVYGSMVQGSGFIILRKATSTNLQGLEYTILEATSYQNNQIFDCFQAIFGINRNFSDKNRNSSALGVRLSIEITYHRRADQSPVGVELQPCNWPVHGDILPNSR